MCLTKATERDEVSLQFWNIIDPRLLEEEEEDIYDMSSNNLLVESAKLANSVLVSPTISIRQVGKKIRKSTQKMLDTIKLINNRQNDDYILKFSTKTGADKLADIAALPDGEFKDALKLYKDQLRVQDLVVALLRQLNEDSADLKEILMANNAPA
ncbi:uncharacterized protein LOC110850938 [Folsomia candida]|uniref:Putative type II secretion system C-type protein YghF n=1 Tax=Folsomia candida TaxID=158441 RepID=A0A226E477_FOLCA|nr:uncharacterized protein LOC110850938 [Folsomia candida]OXA52403.1 putative type II secretion system C-type protein YghF [Folsomia candida]